MKASPNKATPKAMKAMDKRRRKEKRKLVKELKEKKKLVKELEKEKCDKKEVQMVLELLEGADLFDRIINKQK